MKSKKELPIGVFDSGIGGLTVARALKKLLPQEDILYLGDTARLPYGTKSPDIVKSYAMNACDILVEEGVKMLVVACNTASALALNELKQRFHPLPVIGMIHAGSMAALAIEEPGPVLVLATEGTVNSRTYSNMIGSLSPVRQVIEWPCQLMVALAEEGWCQGPLVEQIISKMLAPVFASFDQVKPSCILLGCTHFPVLKNAIENALVGMRVIDPAFQVAGEVSATLLAQNLLREHQQQASMRFLATDGVERFARVAQVFLGEPVSANQVELVTMAGMPQHKQAVG